MCANAIVSTKFLTKNKTFQIQFPAVFKEPKRIIVSLYKIIFAKNIFSA